MYLELLSDLGLSFFAIMMPQGSFCHVTSCFNFIGDIAILTNLHTSWQPKKKPYPQRPSAVFVSFNFFFLHSDACARINVADDYKQSDDVVWCVWVSKFWQRCVLRPYQWLSSVHVWLFQLRNRVVSLFYVSASISIALSLALPCAQDTQFSIHFPCGGSSVAHTPLWTWMFFFSD